MKVSSSVTWIQLFEMSWSKRGNSLTMSIFILVFVIDGPNEKDRELLVHFDVVIAEFLRLKPEYQAVIANITKLMGDGMADYASGEHRENTAVATIKDFDLYCHYVAGLVGYGLSDLFAASGLESEEIAKDKSLSDSMGLFLQKTNIIRDYREDLDDGRQFWPKEIWGKYVDDFSDLTKPEYKDKVKKWFCCLGIKGHPFSSELNIRHKHV